MTSAGRAVGLLPRAVVAAAVAMALGGCSVAVQDHPVPWGTGPLPGDTAVPVAPPPGPQTVTVFFVGSGRLVARTRSVPNGDPLHEALAALVAGPGPGSTPEPLHSALPGSIHDLDVTVASGVANVVVPDVFDRMGSDKEILAVAQLVFTVMAVPGITGLRLVAGGAPVELPTETGHLVSRAVTREDYGALAPG